MTWQFTSQQNYNLASCLSQEWKVSLISMALIDKTVAGQFCLTFIFYHLHFGVFFPKKNVETVTNARSWV